MQDEVLQRARVGPKDDDGRFTVTEALRDQAVVDLSKVTGFPTGFLLLAFRVVRCSTGCCNWTSMRACW